MPEAETVPYVRRGAVTALVAVGGGLTISLVLSLVSGASGVAPVLRTAVRGWLVAVGSGIDVQGTTVGLVPWGGVVAVALLTAYVASRTVEPGEELELGGFAASAAGTAGVLAALGSVLTSTDDVSTSAVRAAFGAFAITGVGAAVGAAARLDRREALWFTEDAEVRSVVRAAARGVAVLLAGGFVLVLAMLATRLDRAGDLWALLDPGLGGGIALGVLCLAAVPTLALWSVSVLIGPGFALGTATSVDLTGSHLGPIPGLPVLAALPGPGGFDDWVVVLALLPPVAGAVAGWGVETRSDDPWRRVGLGAAAGALAGLVIGVLVGLSGGAVGPGRLADAGPPVLSPLLVAVPVLAAGGAIGAALAHYRGARASASDDPTEARASRGPRLRWRKQPPGADRGDGSA